MAKPHIRLKNFNQSRAACFSFGDPTPILDSRGILDYTESCLVDGYYEVPVSFEGLAKSLNASAYHSSALRWKVNKLTSTFVPSPSFSRREFRKSAFDFLIFGNLFIERIDNRRGHLLELKNSPAIKTRKKEDADSYLFLKSFSDKHHFEKGAVWHLLEPDISQEVYGLPYYMAALHAAWLDESATLFRRKYYINGSHAGYIMYLTDTAHKQADIEALRQAMRESKGPGNFRNLFMYAPGGKKDGMQVIPLAETTAKDEFYNIKRASMRDMLAVHRVLPQLIGVIPENNGGFGDANTANELTYTNEIMPLQTQLEELNDWIGEEVVTFNHPDFSNNSVQEDEWR